jgi:hypothetical protein
MLPRYTAFNIELERKTDYCRKSPVFPFFLIGCNERISRGKWIVMGYLTLLRAQLLNESKLI